MKKFMLFLLFSPAFLTVAQDYSNIASPGVTYFGNGGPQLLGYRYDSVSFSGNDSIYFAPNLLLRSNYYSCSDTMGAPVLSRSIVRKPGGTFRFLKITGDTILFLCQASLNQVWTCYQFPTGQHVEAQVTDIRLDTVADTMDLVKEITFMAKNQNGTIYPHPINGIKILLSKNFGFAKTIEWWHFPDSTRLWTMRGKASPKAGIQDFNYHQCYDFEPGDEFHFLYSQFSGMVNTQIIEKILERSYAGGDTIIYSKEVCWIKRYPTSPPNTESYHDTISLIITGTGGATFTSIPEQFIPSFYNGEWNADRFFKPVETFNGREQKNHSEWLYCHPDSCWTEYCGGVDNYGISYDYYAEGLGQTGWYNEWWNGYYHEVNRRDLVYYKKGAEEWGTPYAPDCDVLLSTPELTDEKQSITIFPNPVCAGEPIYIKENLTCCSAVIIDLSGRVVHQSIINQNMPVITSSPDPGIYVLVVKDKDGNCRRTKMIIR